MEKLKPHTNYPSRQSQIISLEKGKIPPQDIGLEQGVIGAMMIDRSAAGRAIELLRDRPVFYKEAHQHIYDAILAMYKESDKIDLLTVSHQLKKMQKLDAAGGEVYLVEMTQLVASTAHLEFHCRILMQFYVKRTSIRTGNELIQDAYDEATDIFDLIDKAYHEFDQLTDWLYVKKPMSFKNHVDAFLNRADNEAASVPCGLHKLQEKLNGYHGNKLIILAARPGMGKTALMLSEAYSQAKRDIPIGIFSLEMSATELVGRIIANELSINAENISKNKLSDFEKRHINQHKSKIENLPIFINENPSLTTLDMRIQVGKWVRENQVKMIYIDYLQLMSATSTNRTGNREQEISSISRALKGIAKEYDIPVMALSQLSRAVEQRGGYKRPILSDLRESGAIEQDADIVIFPLRPEYYKQTTWDDFHHTSCIGQAELNIAKNRGGKTGACLVGAKLEYMRFHDLEDIIPPAPAMPKPHIPKKEDFDDQPFDIPPIGEENEEDPDDIPF